MRKMLSLLLAFSLSVPMVCGAEDIMEMTLEDLLSLEVTSVSKQKESLFNAPASIYVLTGEQIRRSGVRHIAEALRMVPGVEVAQLDSNKWAINVHGKNSRVAGDLLVLIDGRSVYNPLYAGVYWDMQDVLLEDVDRIEVIRGPGGTLWGANAVNGVINIITKSAKDTKGVYAMGGGGTLEKGFGALRYGGQAGKMAYRAYAKYKARGNFVDVTGESVKDKWDIYSGGVRTDTDVSESDLLTIQGDVYRGNIQDNRNSVNYIFPYNFSIISDGNISGGNGLGRWTHTFSDTSEAALQVYYDRTNRDVFYYNEGLDTIDVDFQHSFSLLGFNQIVWGGGYRFQRDVVQETIGISFVPKARRDELISGFVQDRIMLVPDRLSVTVGSKFERNDYTGTEIQPSGRVLWTPNGNNTVWASAAKVVRTPSRIERDLNLIARGIPGSVGTGFLPLFIRSESYHTEEFDSEVTKAYELGYRVKPHESLSLDVAGFYNKLDNQWSSEPWLFGMRTTPIPHLADVSNFENGGYGESRGVDTSVNWKPIPSWKLVAGYTYLHLDLHKRDYSADTTIAPTEDNAPKHSAKLRSLMDLPKGFEFDTNVSYVTALPNWAVQPYVRLDLRLGWQATESLELAIGGQNLIHPEHLEYGDQAIVVSRVPRSYYGYAALRF